MQTTPLKCLTIIAEALLEDRLLRDLREAGVSGFTITEARGEGSRGIRASEWEGKNIKVETLVSPAVCDRLLERLSEHYFPKFAVVAYVETVEVVRGEKYI